MSGRSLSRIARVARRLRIAADARLISRLAVHRDPANQLLFQKYRGRRVYLHRAEDYLGPWHADWVSRRIYYNRYSPQEGDTVVDVGAGYGHEAIYLEEIPRLKFVGVEINPEVATCLTATIGKLGKDFAVCSDAITDESSVTISDEADYVKGSTVVAGSRLVPGLSWKAFRARYGVETVDLLKVNIEGGERTLLPTIGDMADVKRVIISAHDFRADQGDGEFFRTRSFIMEYLGSRGFTIEPLSDAPWLRDWLYAEKR